jgi:hypothetical protein
MDAFEHWYALGVGNRDAQVVADFIDVSIHSITQWQTAFNWTVRAARRDAEICKRITRKLDTDAVRAGVQYRKTINNRLANIEQMLDTSEETKKISVQNLSDYEKLNSVWGKLGSYHE